MKPCSTSGITLGKAHKIKGFRDRKLCSRKPYKLVNHTPKRKAVGSNPAGDARKTPRNSCSPGFSLLEIFAAQIGFLLHKGSFEDDSVFTDKCYRSSKMIAFPLLREGLPAES